MEIKTYETSDLATIALLELHGYKIREIVGERKKFAVFDDTPEIRDFVEQFILGDVRVEPLAYFNQIRTTRYRLINSRS